MNDPINPDYYKRGGIEKYEIIDAWGLDYYTGTALEYILRAGKKDNEVEDLNKAIRTLQHKVEMLTNELVAPINSDPSPSIPNVDTKVIYESSLGYVAGDDTDADISIPEFLDKR
jgi:hypothetical protein